MTDLKLPELPESAMSFEFPTALKFGSTKILPGDYYTAAQLTAYATAAVLAERAAAEADARRYRWLRDSQSRATSSDWPGIYRADSNAVLTGEHADGAIDAARGDDDET